MIDDYLARADALMTATHEGRAFEGAFALLRDDALVTQLREDLTALLEHPLSDRHPRATPTGPSCAARCAWCATASTGCSPSARG